MLKQILVSCFVLACVGIVAQDKTQSQLPERSVRGNVIISNREPEIRIELPDSVMYVGADRWILYDIADCELHAFVESDNQKNVRRLYWVQFEGYLRSKPELKHTYDSPQHAQIGGLDFFVDTWVRPEDAATEPGSDLEHIEGLIHGKGYRMPAGMMYVRLVHLLNAEKRKELMIIYGEDLASTGYTATELSKGGKAYERWPILKQRLIERAEQKVTLSGASRPQSSLVRASYFAYVTRKIIPAVSSLIYIAPSLPMTIPTGRPIQRPFFVSPGANHPVMKSCAPPCGCPLSSSFTRTILYPVGTLRFHEP
jgi:hypothetical protein